MTDMATSWVRTIVPGLWAAVVAWLVSLGLPESFGDQLEGLTDSLLVPVALAGVYALIRWVEPRLPDWLSRVLTGSARTPSYSSKGPGEAHSE